MRVAFASDHAGYDLKQEIMRRLEERGLVVRDFGTASRESCDYPDFVRPAAEALARGDFDRAIVVCGTGIGSSIVANKVPGVRCALCHDVWSAQQTRLHNDSNCLALGARVIGPGVALAVAEAWLETPFEGGRHLPRVEKIRRLERDYCR